MVRAVIDTPSPAVMAHRMRDVAAVDVRSELAGIRAPALALRASRDRLVPASRFVSRDTPIETEVIDGPHLLLHARPQKCASVIEGWLSERGR